MSIWFDIDSENIDIDYESETVDMNTSYDGNGENYHSLTFAQIKEIYGKITKQTQPL